MADLAARDRLQPSLLDRLTDGEPGKRQESREKRVLSLKQLREGVQRDLTWLLNTGNLEAFQDLDDHPEAARSVINFGVRDLTGVASTLTSPQELEQMLTQAILTFEPRILKQSLRVRAVVDQEEMSKRALAFEIIGELWADPTPMQLFLKTDVDLDTGEVSIRDEYGRGAK